MGRVSLGYAVAMHGQGKSAAFSSRVEGLKAMEDGMEFCRTQNAERRTQNDGQRYRVMNSGQNVMVAHI